MYFQIAGVIAQPRYMNEAGYRRYLTETGKVELRRIPVFIRQPEATQARMEELLSEDWVWGGPVHNCETAVEEIIVAGGGPRIHQGPLSLPTHAGWSAWNCGARNCPGHSRRKHQCVGGIWMCNRVVPPCPGHVQSDQFCGTGTAWTCGARSCPTHSQRSHRCAAGVWSCRRTVPPCPGHSSPDHNCLQTG